VVAYPLQPQATDDLTLWARHRRCHLGQHGPAPLAATLARLVLIHRQLGHWKRVEGGRGARIDVSNVPLRTAFYQAWKSRR
jgi:hypothetical protein